MTEWLNYWLFRLHPSDVFQRWAQRIGNLIGWRRNAIAFLAGMLSTLTLPPYFLFPLLVPSFTILIWLLEGASSRRRSFWDGWWWGWGFAITGLYWFCIALMTDAEHFAWLVPFALFGLTGVIAIYSGLACWLTSNFRLSGIAKIFAFSVIWTCVEYIRGHAFSGFPWNLAGYVFGISNAAQQLASIIGIYGLTWVAVLLASSFASMGQANVPPRRAFTFIALLLGALAVTTSWGAWRLHMADAIPEKDRHVAGVKLRLVQANIAQPHKWDPKLRMAGLRQHMDLTTAPGKLDEITHIIWPETAAPYALTDNSPLSHLLGNDIPAGKILITGALRVEGEGEDVRIWNSLVAINHDGKLVGSYDKTRLVPFGEFLPLRSFFPKAWLTPVGEKDFSRGSGAQVVNWPGLPPLTPLICYEAIFPEYTASHGRAQLLLNVTNDAWFGLSSGPYQHFHMARLRAVEQGIPLVRVANTGITAVTDAYGRVEVALPLGVQGVLDAQLPIALEQATTYSKVGDIILPALIFMLSLLMLRQRTHQKN